MDRRARQGRGGTIPAGPVGPVGPASLVMLTMLVTGCAALLPQARPAPSPSTSVPRAASATAAAPTPGGDRSAGGNPTARGERPAGQAVLKAPANPCRVLTARTRAAIKMPTAKRDRRDVACRWTNEPGDAPPFVLRDLKIDYSAELAGMPFTEEEAEAALATRRRQDYRQPSVFGGAPAVKGAIRRIGSARAGDHFDEGYYVYHVYRVAEARRGEGRAVLRKGNVIITVTVSGADIPTRRVRDGRPITNATAQALIDAVATQAIAAVR